MLFRSVFSKIYTHGKGTPVVIPHMGLCTPMSAIYEWLQKEGCEHLLSSAKPTSIDIQNLSAPGK